MKKLGSILIVAITLFSTLALTDAGRAQAGGPTATDGNKVTKPAGWFLAGSAPAAYGVGVDNVVKHGGNGAAFLKSIKDPGSEFGTLMQSISAKKYRGKRVRLAAWVKTEKAIGWAGLWMRVDGAQGATLAFDNMQDRSIKNTTEWTRYEVVLDVDKSATSISFGTLMEGAGSLWIDDVEVEIVAKSVPTTVAKSAEHPETAENLGFEN
jgi:hypothetical protein